MKIALDNFSVVEEIWIEDIDFARCDGSLKARKSQKMLRVLSTFQLIFLHDY